MSIFEISIFGFNIAPKWYWAMYAFGFIICYTFMKKWGKLSNVQLDSLLIFVFFWVILGWRLGYILFYSIDYYLAHPFEIFSVWNGWMSFHGWLLGVIVAVVLFSKKYSLPFFQITDSLAIIVPVAIGLWRLGNYLNNELLGYSPYYGPFAMFKNWIPHFPSPLFEMLLEWIVLTIFMLMWAYQLKYFSQKKSDASLRNGILSGLFLIGYWFLRIISEVYRLPDVHIWYLFWTNWLTLWAVYTFPLLLIGFWIIYITKK
jgi:phosphatidylglycerol:prolipoprotein diacylglycerol transferase